MILRAVNTQPRSYRRNFANLKRQGVAIETTPSWVYTFYLGDMIVGQLTEFLSGLQQLALSEGVFEIKRTRLGMFSLDWVMERDGQLVASAQGSRAKWEINYKGQERERELILRPSFWSLKVNYRLFEAEQQIGTVMFARNGEATIDLPEEISLPLRLFIFNFVRMRWDAPK